MTIYSLPYTYLIGWSKHQKFYYGVRYARGCHPDDLWVKYFTSSAPVQKFRVEHGEPDIITVRRTFQSIDDAREWEHVVLRRMKVVLREDFFNRTHGKSITMLGKKQPESMKRRLSEMFKGKPGRTWTSEQKQKASASHMGMKFSDEHRNNISKNRIGIKFSDEHLANLRKARETRTPEQRAAIGAKISAARIAANSSRREKNRSLL